MFFLPAPGSLGGGTPVASPGERTAWQGWQLLVCLDHSELLDRAPSLPPKSLPGPPRRWAQGGSQREAVVLRRKESRGVANAGVPWSNMSWGSCRARRGTEPRAAPPNAPLASRKGKGSGQGRDPSGGGEVFWGAPSFLLLAVTAHKRTIWRFRNALN